MDSIKSILEKIEHPINFAFRDNFKNLQNIKDLGKTMLNLLSWLKNSPWTMKNDEAGSLVVRLHEIFSDYDWQKLELKKLKIQTARELFERLKSVAESSLRREYENLSAATAARRIEEVREAMAKLELPVQYLKGVGPRMAARFAAKKIMNVEDLLYFLPRTYEDRREIKKINRLEAGKIQTAVGSVVSAQYRHYSKKRVLEVVISDDTAALTAKWFKGRMNYLLGIFKKGVRVILTGEVRPDYAGKSMIHPDYEILEEKDEDNLLNFKRIVPVYSETEGLHQKYFRKVVNSALDHYARYVVSPIPDDILERRKLISIREALRMVHFPDNNASLEKLIASQSEAHRRLIYDEFFYFQLGLAVRKKSRILEKGISFNVRGELLSKFFALLPFDLTEAQKRVVREIQEDMSAPTAMNRLLQGDVGSGKTVVSMAAMVIACDNGYQAAMMAPTEILARQHYENIKKWSEDLGLKIVLLIGNLSSAHRKNALEKIRNGEADIVIGTHALIQEDVNFRRLGIAVIDEQHRFGVMQRATMRAKGIDADVLVMTATPIPRTLAMTVYGDLDVSVIDEMPPGKKPVRTILLSDSQRDKVYRLIKDELEKGHQAFVVYPLVEQSEALDLKDATNMARHLQEDIFPDNRIGLIHGRMKDKEKDAVMKDFLENKIQILVSTTVVEVGIDVPRASLMVIEHAERFGLSQLHQLRGRVGRRDIPSTCVLLADYRCSADAHKRLKVMERTTDGFEIAEEDLAIRGPGDFLGTRQSGLPDFRIASIVRDARILNDAKQDAFALAQSDPCLEKPEHLLLKEILLWKWRGKLDLARIG